MHIKKQFWSDYSGGSVYQYTLSNGFMEVTVTNFGCAITSINVPDLEKNKRNIVLGYDSFEEYLHDKYYMGAIVGRFANRISGGILPVNKTVYQLPVNEPANNNHLHGGFNGFNKKLFSVISEEADDKKATIIFKYRSEHMDEGYPGNLDVWITYELSITNQLVIRYEAQTDQDTHINLTNHTYFNLDPYEKSSIGQHLFINSAQYLEDDERFLPTGVIKWTDTAAYDFSGARRIDKYWSDLANGYNTYYLLDKERMNVPDAILSSERSGIIVSIKTSFPGILLYSGDYLGKPYLINQGICLETQFCPDTPNRPEFPSTLLKEGEIFLHHTSYQFEAM
ncbi:MAG: aldose epimerase family protein [Flavitalea sp.]